MDEREKTFRVGVSGAAVILLALRMTGMLGEVPYYALFIIFWAALAAIEAVKFRKAGNMVMMISALVIGIAMIALLLWRLLGSL